MAAGNRVTGFASRRERRQDARRRLLDEHVPDRRCPSCGKTKLRSGQWVAVEIHLGSSRAVVCRSCAMRSGRWKKGR